MERRSSSRRAKIPLRASIVKILRHTRLGARIVAPMALLGKNGYSYHTGWARSATERLPVDREGRPVPWLSYPAIEFLDDRVERDWRVFEFGCGNSTLWWAERVAEVVSVEHYEPWYVSLAPRVPENVTLQFQLQEPAESYARSPLTAGGGFHVMVIDGRQRVACARSAVPALTPDGVIVFDNTDRERYRAGLDHLSEAGFRRISFRGLGPVNACREETSILYRPDNCLRI